MAQPPWATPGSLSNPSSVNSNLLKTPKFEDHDLDEDLENNDADAEGVWSADIEQSFHEALAIYPPCGRRKIILSDEGKMYGRNELIARYIKVRTGKTRTRKQVSSHIQVLARRRSKEIQSHIKDPVTKEKTLQQLQQLSSAQLISVPPQTQVPAIASHNTSNGSGYLRANPSSPITPPLVSQTNTNSYWGSDNIPFPASTPTAPVWSSSHIPDVAIASWMGKSIAGSKMRLVELSAFMEKTSHQDSQYPPLCHIFAQISPQSYSYSDPLLENVDITQIWDKFPETHGLKELYERGPTDAFFLVKFWASVNTVVTSDAFYGVTMILEGTEYAQVKLGTKVCSFGKQVVEKLEVEHPSLENGRYVYRFERSPMCDYMKSFIGKLLQLPQKPMMNSVLENFTILQIVSNKDTGETLLCIAYVFEVSQNDNGAQHQIYRLTRPL